MSDEHDAFISYAHADFAAVESVVKLLQIAGVRVWLDRERLRPGHSFNDRIAAAIANCRTFLLMASPASFASQYVTDELLAALDLKKTIIPTFLPNCAGYPDGSVFSTRLTRFLQVRLGDRSAADWLPEMIAAFRDEGIARHEDRHERERTLAARVSDLERAATRLTRDMKMTQERLNQVYLQLQDHERIPKVVEDEFDLSIEADGRLKAVQRMTLEPGDDQPLQMLYRRFHADEAVDSFWDLTFHVDTDPMHQVVVLPADDRPQDKHLLFFFLPQVLPGQQLQFELRWEWPNFWKPLLTRGLDYWGYVVRSCEAVDRIRVRFRVHASLGPLALSHTGQGVGQLAAKTPAGGAEEYDHYDWHATNLKPMNKLRVRLDKATSPVPRK